MADQVRLQSMILVHPLIHSISVRSIAVSSAPFAAVTSRFRPQCAPSAPLLPVPEKIIWQCYSELGPPEKNTLAAPLEVNAICPYLCTTPQGRDGRRATDNREGKGPREAGNRGTDATEERASEIISKKILRFRKRFLPLQSQPGETAMDAMSGATENDRLRPSFTEGRQHKKSRSEMPRREKFFK